MALFLSGCTITDEMINSVQKLKKSQKGVYNTCAFDDYGEKVVAVNAMDEQKYVGMFYALWLGQDTPSKQDGKNSIDEVYYGDDSLNKFKDMVLNSKTAYRYWGEPLYGYYKSDDEWVIRKHLQLLTLAGVDYLALDVTNAITYSPVLKILLSCIAEYRTAGINVPQVLFLTNSGSTTTAINLYEEFYIDSKYESCWFKGQGTKPWISCYTNQGTSIDETTLKNYFYVKDPQWPNEKPKANGLPWIDWSYPQKPYYDEQIEGNIYAVAIAEHTGVSAESGGIQFSDSAYAKLLLDNGLATKNDQGLLPSIVYDKNHGRGYDFTSGKNAYENKDKIKQNINFKQQWDTVYKDENAKMALVLGWNEWIAGNWQKSAINNHYDELNTTMCDLVNFEFSRDIEMMKDGENSYFDNCYLQLCQYIRKFKGLGSGKAYLDTKNTNITSSEIIDSEWEDIDSYISFKNSAKRRSIKDVFGVRQLNETGRNDIASIKVVKNSENLFFLIETVADISEKKADDRHWMNVYIGVVGKNEGFNNLQYVINRETLGGKPSVHKLVNNDYHIIDNSNCKIVVNKNKMLLTIPKITLGIDDENFAIEFKIADNNSKDFDISDFYINGDVAPLGRINYIYSTK